MPRLTTPSASAASIIRGKMVTMSNFIQFQQSPGRIDPDLLVCDVDLHADVDGERNQDLTTRTVHHQPARSGAAFDFRHLANDVTRRGLDRAANELMLVPRARLQGLKRSSGTRSSSPASRSTSSTRAKPLKPTIGRPFCTRIEAIVSRSVARR